MIEQITGRIIQKSPTFCVVDCGGVGMGLNISLNTFQKIKSVQLNSQVSLFTHLHVREDLLQLYGFSETEEKEFFRMLISVSGIGPRLALTLLSGPTTKDIKNAISREDVAILTRVPGIGRKTAQRLILELKEKMATGKEVKGLPPVVAASDQLHEKINEAIQALVQLGYKQEDAHHALSKLADKISDEISVEQIIKMALKSTI
jgi:Holliday junction DNA helicase RuvA